LPCNIGLAHVLQAEANPGNTRFCIQKSALPPLLHETHPGDIWQNNRCRSLNRRRKGGQKAEATGTEDLVEILSRARRILSANKKAHIGESFIENMVTDALTRKDSGELLQVAIQV
jgi:hypothetical protein